MIDCRTVSNASTFSSGQKHDSIVLFAEMHYSYNAKRIQHAHTLITVIIAEDASDCYIRTYLYTCNCNAINKFQILHRLHT